MIDYCCPNCGEGSYIVDEPWPGRPPEVYNDEGRPVMFCFNCDEELTAESVVDIKTWVRPMTEADIAYERAQASEAWQRRGGGGL